MMNLHQDMDREQMRMAILSQEHIFRQQVHELHRLYHVQKQLMQQAQAQTAAPVNHAPAPVVDVKPRPQQLDIWCGEKATTTTPKQQIISFTSCTTPTTPATPTTVIAEECNLELTLATGPSSSSSNSSSCGAERRQGKRLKASSNSDSGVSSTSTDSELAQFREVEAAATPVRFHGEVSRRMDEVGQGPWMYQCLSLKMA